MIRRLIANSRLLCFVFHLWGWEMREASEQEVVWWCAKCERVRRTAGMPTPPLDESSEDVRLVKAVAYGWLNTSLLFMCPNGDGRPQEFGDIQDVPLEIACSCGQVHRVLLSNLSIQFHVPQQSVQ